MGDLNYARAGGCGRSRLDPTGWPFCPPRTASKVDSSQFEPASAAGRRVSAQAAGQKRWSRFVPQEVEPDGRFKLRPYSCVHCLKYGRAGGQNTKRSSQCPLSSRGSELKAGGGRASNDENGGLLVGDRSPKICHHGAKLLLLLWRRTDVSERHVPRCMIWARVAWW